MRDGDSPPPKQEAVPASLVLSQVTTPRTRSRPLAPWAVWIPRPSAQKLGAVVVTGLKKRGSDSESSTHHWGGCEGVLHPCLGMHCVSMGT